MPFTFRMWVVVALHNSLSFVALNNILSTISLRPCPVIHFYNISRHFIRCFPVSQDTFLHYMSQKCQLSHTSVNINGLIALYLLSKLERIPALIVFFSPEFELSQPQSRSTLIYLLNRSGVCLFKYLMYGFISI